MKKLLALTLAALMLLTLFVACGKKEEVPDAINIYTLNGTTGFGMAKLMEDAQNGVFTTENYTFSVKTDATEVLAALTSGTVDIAALPTNAASNVYNKTKGGVKMLAINTLGCLFLLNSGESTVASIAELGGKTVYAPAQNPTFILTYLCQQNGLEVITEGTPTATQVFIDSTSYAQPANLRDAIATKQVELAVLPEPMVTIAVNKAKSQSITLNIDLDLTAEWDKLPNKANTLVQWCVVVRKAFLEEHPEAVANFMKAYKASIEYLNANVAEAAALVKEHGIFDNENVAKLAIPKCNVKYVDGAEMKTATAADLEILKGINPNSIGGAVPGDDFYYNANS